MLTGHYTTQAGLHFLHRSGPNLPLIGEVTGPIATKDVAELAVVKPRATVLQDAHFRLYGAAVPGREPVTRLEYRHWLEMLAHTVATEAEWQRQVQLRRQFDSLADRIGLAGGKRAWVLAEAKWRLRSSAAPAMADLWVDAVASPSCFARPREQDFDPDPAQRRRRTPRSPAARADPHSIPNMLVALLAHGLKARITRLGDPPDGQAHIQIDMPVKGRSRFVAIAERIEAGTLSWRLVWDGNHSEAGLRRKRRAEATEDYHKLRTALRDGRQGVQSDLFL